MPPRSHPPFRADHVGSLLRPEAVHRARAEFAAGEITEGELRRREDEAIRAVVRMQEDVGLQTRTDGEFRRASWHMDFIYQLDGVSKAPGTIDVHFRNAEGAIDYTPPAMAVDGKLGVTTPIFGEDFVFLQSVATTGTPKLTIPSPSMVHYRGGRAAIDPEVYPDIEEFWTDLSAAYAAQIAGIGALGCTYLQLDDTSLAYLNDPAERDDLATRGSEGEAQHERYIKQINAALAGKPDGMHVTTHLCRGNYRSSWVASGGYDYVAEALFGELAVDGFFLEYDDERSGGFEPLRFVPPGKQVVLGLITTKRGQLEDADAVKRRIEEAATYVPIEQLCLSPQCGFSSTVEGNNLTYDEQVAKLQLIVDIAQDVWG